MLEVWMLPSSNRIPPLPYGLIRSLKIRGTANWEVASEVN